MVSLAISARSAGFTLSYRGVELLRHSDRRPCCGVGLCDFDYRISHGMYHVRRDRKRRWVEAGAFSVHRPEDGSVEIAFPGLLVLAVSERGGRLVVEPRVTDPAWNRLDIRFSLPPKDAIYGCGEQFSYLDLREKNLRLQVSEPGVGRGPNYIKVLADLHSGVGGWRDNSYFPLPCFVSSGGLSLLADTDAFCRFDFRRRGQARLSFREIPRSLQIGVNADLAAAVCGLSESLGRQPEPPQWCYDGAWLGIQGGRDRVEKKLTTALSGGAAVAALWCQDWQGIRMTSFGKQLFWNWEWDRSLYPEPESFVASLHARGVKFLGYINPFVANDAPMFKEGSEKGCFVRNAQGAIYETKTTTFPVAVLDLTSDSARSWFKETMAKNLIGGGLDGWMADFGEYLPPDCRLASGEDPRRVHNRYAADWARLNREVIEESGALGRATFFCRSGWTGSPRSALLFWAGDQLVGFQRDNGLPSVLTAALSAGMSGIGMWHFDVGGFLSLAWIRRDFELLARSAEFAAFTQFFRTHEGINPPANVQFDADERSLSHFCRMTRVYAALAPYHRRLGAEYRSTGLPPIRLPRLHYPDSPLAIAARDQYLYGPDLMVAPVLRRGLRSRQVSLPEDDWVHLWSGESRRGGRFRAEAPLGEPPVWYRRASPFAELFAGIAERASKGERS